MLLWRRKNGPWAVDPPQLLLQDEESTNFCSKEGTIDHQSSEKIARCIAAQGLIPVNRHDLKDSEKREVGNVDSANDAWVL